jgi:hypothetical protein
MENMFELLATAPAVADEPGARSLRVSEGRVDFKEVRLLHFDGYALSSFVASRIVGCAMSCCFLCIPCAWSRAASTSKRCAGSRVTDALWFFVADCMVGCCLGRVAVPCAQPVRERRSC